MIVIVGGGVGGLGAGVALRQKGFECEVWERDAFFGCRSQGFGMTLNADADGALGKLGVLDECKSLSCESRCHWTFDGDGKVIGYFGRFHDGQGTGGNLRVQRQQLRRVLLERFESLGGRVVWDRRVKDANEIDAELVVGADGVNSVIRTCGPELSRVGVSVAVGLSTFQHALLDGQGFYVLDGQHRLFTMPFSSDLTMWQLSSSSKQFEPSLESAKDLAKSRWRASIPAALDLIEATVEVWATNFVDRDPMVLNSKSKAMVTVLGDAAHPMTCFKGQGANQALKDGLTLADCLEKGGVNFTSLRRFEREMTQRAAPRALASRQAARDLHCRDSSRSPVPSFPGLDRRQSELVAAELSHLDATHPPHLLLEELKEAIERLSSTRVSSFGA